MKSCALCMSRAITFCESDQAALCWDCDAKVHGPNFLVARHSRTLLCHTCQSLTPWKASGAKLGHTISVCDDCVNRAERRRLDEESFDNGDPRVDFEDDEEEDDLSEDEDEDEDENENGDCDDEEEEEDEQEEEEEEEEDGDNQVVPWTASAAVAAAAVTPPPAVSSSSSEEECNKLCSSKRMRGDTRNLSSQLPQNIDGLYWQQKQSPSSTAMETQSTANSVDCLRGSGVGSSRSIR